MSDEILNFLIDANIPKERASKYTTNLIKNDIETLEFFKTLEERDLLHDKVGMSVGDLARIRSHLKGLLLSEDSTNLFK